MGNITSGIKKTCLRRSEETKKRVKRLLNRLPILSAERDDDYAIVNKWITDLREDIYRNPASVTARDFYLDCVIEGIAVLIYSDLPENIKRSVAQLFGSTTARLMQGISASCTYDIEYYDIVGMKTDFSTEIAKEILNQFIEQNNLGRNDAEEKMIAVLEDLKRSNLVVISDAAAERLCAETRQIIANFDIASFVNDLKEKCADNIYTTEMILCETESLQKVICSAISECVLLNLILHGNITDRDHRIPSGRYLRELQKRFWYSAWDETVRSLSAEASKKLKNALHACIQIMDDKMFLDNLQNDFSVWSKLGDLLLQPEYYKKALSGLDQQYKKKKLEKIMEECNKTGTRPDNKLLKKLICTAVNKMPCLDPKNHEQDIRIEIYGAFDSTILNKSLKSANKGWFAGDISKLPKSGSVNREHVFQIAFALQLSVEDAEMLLLDGAQLEGFDSKCVREVIYQYCLNWKLSYADAWMMWLECIGLMLYNDSAAGFRKRETDPEDLIYTEGIQEGLSEFFQFRDEHTDKAFQEELASSSQISIEELSQWLVWKYQKEHGYDEKTTERLVHWLGRELYDEIVEKLSNTNQTIQSAKENADAARAKLQQMNAAETEAQREEYIKTARRTAAHKTSPLKATMHSIQKMIEKTYSDMPRVIRQEDAVELCSRLIAAWKTIMDDFKEAPESIENEFLYLFASGIPVSDNVFSNDRRMKKTAMRTLANLLEGEDQSPVPGLGRPFTAEILHAHREGQLLITRTDVLRYCFWLTMFSKESYEEYNSEQTFLRFQEMANRWLAEGRFHQFYVRSALDRFLYICFWDDRGPMEAYLQIMEHLQTSVTQELTQEQVNAWKETILSGRDKGDEFVKSAVGSKGIAYMKAIIWLTSNGVFLDNQPIWQQLYHLANLKRTEDIDTDPKWIKQLERIQARYENNKQSALAKIEKAVETQEKRLSATKEKYDNGVKRIQKVLQKTTDPVEKERLENQLQSVKRTFEADTEKIQLKLAQLQTEKTQWDTDEILASRIAKNREQFLAQPKEFLCGCKAYFLRFYECLGDWYFAMQKPYPWKKIEAMKAELNASDLTDPIF